MASDSGGKFPNVAKKAETLNLDSTEVYSSAVSSASPVFPPPLSSPSIPPSNRIPKTKFIVDFFRFPQSSSSVAFFLSHFHSDHYSGLSPSWSRGIIYCSHKTARLVKEILQVPSRFVFPLPMQQAVMIDGSEVVLIEANHCPGAVQFLFKVRPEENGSFERYVHTGDFRFCDSMRLDSFLSAFIGCDGVFLDTTYCNPKFVFPTQEESVDYVVSVIDKIDGESADTKKKVLFLVATYVVGKEKILVEIARRCKRKIFVDARKMSVLSILGCGEDGMFTEDRNESDVHVVGWNLLGFVPTGWTYEVKRNKFAVKFKDSMEIHLVPYSEHSNYDELREYIKFLKPKRVIPTVGVDIEKLDSREVYKMQKHFSGLVDEMANKKDFLLGFYRQSYQKSESGSSVVYKGEDKKACEDSGNGVPLLHDTAPTSDSSVTERLLIELRDCLPAWVSEEQMLDMINKHAGNAVDIVSNFYECETELYKQSTRATSPLENQAVSFDDVTVLQPNPVKSTSSDFQASQTGFALPSKMGLTKGTISPAKRGKSIGTKSNKKAKKDPKSKPVGPRQSTITKFFDKALDSGSNSVGVGSATEECNTDENMVHNDATEAFKEVTDQFINIINGSESLRNYAASIIHEAKGDINRALNIYYSNPSEIPGAHASEGGLSSKSVQFPQCPEACSSQEEKNASEKTVHAVNLWGQTSAEEIVDKNYVSLPPEKYKPKEHACWRDGQPAPYIHLVRTFASVEGEKGKIKAMSMLCNMFRSLLALSPEDVLPAVYLCTNKIAADHENIELNIGGSLISSALEEACGISRSTMREMYNNMGDLGDVAQLCRQTQKLLIPPPPLLVRDVFSTLRKISVQTGTGSTRQKKDLIVKLMRSCREKEIKFLVRTLSRNLRIGAMLRTVLPALGRAVVMNSFWNCYNKESSENCFREKLEVVSAAVVEAYNILPSLDVVVPSLLDKDTEFSTSTLSMIPGIPIKPMLAKIANGVEEFFKLFQDKAFTCEYKYDGQRAQIHQLLDGTVRIFSRNGDETTSRFPDLVDVIKQFACPAAQTFMLDAEVVATDRKNGNRLMSFQELSTRERGSKDALVTTESIKVEICVFVFDIMFFNGEQLLALPLRERRGRLKEVFPESRPGYLEYAKEITVGAEEASLNYQDTLCSINAFLEEAFQSSCEGIMVKSLDVDAGYCPTKRSDSWLKVKRDYVKGLGDTLDLVPIGAWHGNGRKAGWYSPFLMACFNPETEEFQSVCRVMSGFSDAFYIEIGMKEFYSGDKILAKKPPYYRTGETPDMWFSAEVVWEVRGADFTVSPIHNAAIGLVHPSRGISVRFPRFIRKVMDRNPEECSTAADIAEMFHAQTRKMNITTQH
ncbi:hypothetical protein AALP_AA2G081800 [Arabis alpina]|uniref:DNA ligase n=1 Tax=Arabis alpina TaxID=50452 RepID=A0A087HG19_ARAAL|nr:hypothetical protein AALP_AA2G081800 [Arabis alpina]